VTGAEQEQARVIENRRLTSEIFQLSLRLPRDWGPPTPGQFVQVECLPGQTFAMRRPFSIARSRRGELGNEIHLVYAPVGRGTEELTRRVAGDLVAVTGPLGRGFRPVPEREPILVGGGRGIAPMLMLADSLRPEFRRGTILFGVRRASQLYRLEAVPYPVRVATEDGSEGFHGNLLELLEHLRAEGTILPSTHALYGCGPNAMLHALSDWASLHRFGCQVSLETLFGCGFGICAGCAVPVRPAEGERSDEFGHYRFACIDGPVFEGSRVDWAGVRE
jgi:dihydroorotate dehydrogenase electron transfer subunit